MNDGPEPGADCSAGAGKLKATPAGSPPALFPTPADLAEIHGLIPAQRASPEAPGERAPLEPHGQVADVERARVLLRYARLTAAGRPIFCKPSRAEIAGDALRRQGPGTDGKVIYPDRASAEAAALELEALGARPQRPYICRRSRRGHYHLTTDLVAERQRTMLAEGMPRQRDRRSA